MSDAQGDTPIDKKNGQMATVIYILYLVGLVSGLTPVIGVIMAYVLRGGNPPWVESHYVYQIGSFWRVIAAIVIAVVFVIFSATSDTSIASWLFILFLIFMVIWWIVRNIRGMAFAVKGKAAPGSSTPT